MSVDWGLSCVFPLREDAGLNLVALQSVYRRHLRSLYKGVGWQLRKQLPHPLPRPLAPLAVLLEEEVGFSDHNLHIMSVLEKDLERLVQRDHPHVTFSFLFQGTCCGSWSELKRGRHHERYDPERVVVVEELIRLGYDPKELVVCDPILADRTEAPGGAPCLPPSEVRQAVQALIETVYRYEEELQGTKAYIEGDAYWLEFRHLGIGEAVELQMERIMRVCRTAERYSWLVAGSTVE